MGDSEGEGKRQACGVRGAPKSGGTLPECEVREYPARRLGVGLCVKWRGLLRHKQGRGARGANNTTERVMGKGKIRI